MDAGAEAELPAVIVVLGFPVEGQRGLRISVGAHGGEAVEDQASGEAAGALPGIAFDFDAHRAAVVGAGARGCRDYQRGDETANCNLP
jgi:hypothetical protein